MYSETDIEKCIQFVITNEEEWKAKGLCRINLRKKKLLKFSKKSDDFYTLEPSRSLSEAVRSAIKAKRRMDPSAEGTIQELG